MDFPVQNISYPSRNNDHVRLMTAHAQDMLHTSAAATMLCALSIMQAVKHEMLTQCWANVGPLSTTLNQYWVTVLCLAPRWMCASITDSGPALTLSLPISHLCENYLPLPNSHFCENQMCIHAVIAIEIFITCVVVNRQPEWSVTWTWCSLAFLICAMCACYNLYCAQGLPQGILLKKEVGFSGYFYQGAVGRGRVNPASVQSIMPVPTACRYCQHEVLTRAEWIPASTSHAGPTFNRHWVGVGLYSPPAVSTTRPAGNWTQLPVNTRRWTSAGLMLDQHSKLWASIGLALGHRHVCLECWQATLFFARRCGVENGIINSA